jgi:hypothetical protein
MKKLQIKCCLLLLVVPLVFSSCIDSKEYEIKRIKGNPTIDLPLVSGDLVTQDFISEADNVNIVVGTDGLLSIVYEQTLKSQGVSDLFVFPDKSFNKIVPIPPTTLAARTSEIKYASLNSNEDFSFSPEKLSEIKFKNTVAKITVSFSPSLPSSSVFEVNLKLPTCLLNGVPFEKRIPLGSSTATFALRDYVATLVSNSFPMEITVFEKPHASSVVIASNTTASVKLDFTILDYQYLKGFFGDQSVLNIPSETIFTDEFNNSLNGAAYTFKEPKVSLAITNDYGIPVTVSFQSLEGRKNNGASLPLVTNPTSPLKINSPVSLGQAAITNVTVTNTNDLITFRPDLFYYKLTAKINDGLTSGANFCADTSKMRVKLKAEIPLYGKASGIILADTFDIDLTDAKNSQVESGTIVSKIRNELPLDAFIQLYIANSNAIIIDSLFTTAQTALIKSSTVNATGDLVTPSNTNNETPIPKEKLDKIFDAKKMIVKVRMNTTFDAGKQVDVKFKSTYKISVAFGLKAKLKLNVDL